MFKLFKYWKQHIGTVLVIIVLLVVQAYCDIALPSYTADIVDTGISSSGIEYATPIKMSSDTYKNIAMFLSSDNEQKLKDAYDLKDDNIYKLNHYGKKHIKELSDIVGMPIMMIMNMSRSEDSNEFNFDKINQMRQAYEAGMMTKDELTQMISQMNEKFGDYSEMMASKASVVFLKDEYKRVGVDSDQIQNQYLIRKGLSMLLFAVVAMMTSIIVGLLASKVAAKIGMNLREKVFKKVVAFSNTEIDKFSTASLITRSTNDIQQIQMVTVLLLRMVMYAPVLAIGGIIKVLSTDTGLDWIIVLAVIVILGLVAVLMAIALPKFKIMQDLMDKLNLVSREILTGVFVIRAFGREKQEEERFEKANKELMGTQLFTNRVMTFMMPTMMLIMNGVSVLIVWMGSKGIDEGKLQVGDMIAFITYAIMIIMSFLMLTMISIMLPRAAVSSGRIEEVLNSDICVSDRDHTEKMDKKLDHITGIIKFDNVSFRYPQAEEDALCNLSFTASPGKTTAIIGSTGCGKSTLLNLIPRFYDVTEGCITIDGVDIRDISQHKLRSILGLVPQKGLLFSGDIESNIKFGGSFINDDDMKLAADIAQASEFINEKPDKFSSEIAQGGTNVSGGQKQRLSIARAIAKKPKVFLFDDSFSALDYKTDVTLRKALNENIKDATVIIVAQRISTILHADQIIVLDEGKIAGIGTHEQLLKNCESYQEIAKSQLSEEELRGGMA